MENLLLLVTTPFVISSMITSAIATQQIIWLKNPLWILVVAQLSSPISFSEKRMENTSMSILQLSTQAPQVIWTKMLVEKRSTRKLCNIVDLSVKTNLEETLLTSKPHQLKLFKSFHGFGISDWMNFPLQPNPRYRWVQRSHQNQTRSTFTFSEMPLWSNY